MNNKKKGIFFAAFFLVVFSGYIFLSQDPKANLQEFSEYYRPLAKECESKDSYSCCIASVKNMESGNYSLVQESGCPEGYTQEMLKCIDSYKWCTKIATNSLAQIHNCTNEEKQAEICTMEYIAVCGVIDNYCGNLTYCKENNLPCGACWTKKETYSSGCVACSSGVDYWTLGECVS